MSKYFEVIVSGKFDKSFSGSKEILTTKQGI